MLRGISFFVPAGPFVHALLAWLRLCNAYTHFPLTGGVVALVGASGVGKSTVLKLLQRFYDPDKV